MNQFEYARPATVAEAIELLAEGSGPNLALAGGTDLLSLMKDYVVEPKRLVALSSVAELRGVSTDASGLKIGATATIDDLLASADVRSKWAALAQAAEGIRSPQLRAMGTVGGELLQRPRCWYFRHGHGLLALDAGGGSLVTKGDHRYHAVLGNGGAAKFVSPSSLAPALIALRATAKVVGRKGERTLAVAELFQTPAKPDEREHALAPDEVLAQILVPAGTAKSATYEVRPRQGLDWPLAAASVALQLDGGKVTSATVVLGHVAPKPWISEGAAKALAGQALDEKSMAAAAEAAVAGATPLPGNAYKIDLAKVAVRRALALAGGAKS
jgi:xanthine dehydrogenase YagS FAD-binding subunit